MKKDKRGLLFVGGEAPDRKWYNSLVERFDVIVAADGGFDLAIDLGVRVDKVVGDMDSVLSIDIMNTYDHQNVIRYSEEKDDTDTEIGLKTLREMGCEYICIYGGGGGRLDHLVGLLALFDRELFPDLWITNSHMVVSIVDSVEIVGKMGYVVSFFPVGKKSCTMTSSGLKWDLNGLIWEKGDCGISNVISEQIMQVRVATGRLVMISELGLLDEVIK